MNWHHNQNAERQVHTAESHNGNSITFFDIITFTTKVRLIKTWTYAAKFKD